jgi:hypothetical protein
MSWFAIPLANLQEDSLEKEMGRIDEVINKRYYSEMRRLLFKGLLYYIRNHGMLRSSNHRGEYR